MTLPPKLAWLLAGALLLAGGPSCGSIEPCRLEVVDKENGWPVPLVILRTTHQSVFVTDNAGVIALDAPELMGREVWFNIMGHGYGIPKDGFGMRGVRLKPVPGGRLKVEVRRTNIAKRLGRVTGSGLFAESQKLGKELDVRDAGVFGCDSVQNAVHRGKMYWAWGDTHVPNYPLGIFDMTGATTPVAPITSFEPPVRLSFDYFKDGQGKVRGLAPMPGKGPTWVTGFVSLKDRAGQERLCGSYIKVRNHLEAYQSGLCVWNDAKEEFELLRVVWTKSETSPKEPPIPSGHPAFWKDSQGTEFVLFGNPLPTLRCPAAFEAWQDSAKWEILKPQESLVSTNEAAVKPHSGSIAWNAFRRRWVTVFMESFGKPSAFGELWYAEADAPQGPWGRAVKILTHDNYTFYNPRLHPEFTPEGSPILLFEGTYTEEFADRPQATARYNYNQILYRLDLDEPALASARQP
jgi:hypothetical protein